jgi:hypothetical protein
LDRDLGKEILKTQRGKGRGVKGVGKNRASNSLKIGLKIKK